MKYLLMIPIAVYFLLRDIAVLLKHGDLLRGLIIFILLSISVMLGCLLMNAIKEINCVRKKLGNKTYDWMVNR